MGYATEAEFIETFGLQLTIELTNLEAPDATTVNSTVFIRGATRAAGIIDGYIGSRYALPLTTVPDLLVTLSMDIQRYQMAHHGQEEDVRQRYEDALKMLEKISKGTIDLGLPLVDAVAPTSGSPACIHSGRVFTNSSLGGGSYGGFV